MRRHRFRVVLTCLLALVWCQLSAAAQLCGISSDASEPIAADARPACHDAPDADPCMATDCPASQALKDGSTTAFAFVPPALEQFLPVRALVHAPLRTARAADALPTGPPPHFLGRLLI